MFNLFRKRKKKYRQPARFWKWKVVGSTTDIHPYVMMTKDGVGKNSKGITAKLHGVKAGEKLSSNYIYFDKSPNPTSKAKGAFYRNLRRKSKEQLFENKYYKGWHVSKDGRRKMKNRWKEQKQSRRKQIMNKKKKRKDKTCEQEKTKKKIRLIVLHAVSRAHASPEADLSCYAP